MRHRLARIDGTPYAIAAGFACGASISFTPFVGLHFLIAALVSWVVRGNILTSAMGTAVGNPWTFPFIWTSTYNLGVWLLGRDVNDDVMVQMNDLLNKFTIVDIVNEPFYVLGPFVETIFLPMLLGGVIIGACLWIVFYWPLYKLVANYKINRIKRRQKKQNIKLKNLER